MGYNLQSEKESKESEVVGTNHFVMGEKIFKGKDIKITDFQR